MGIDLGMGFLGSALFAHVTLILAVYLMHLFCWRVGLLYRAHHEDFPWAFQYHVRTPRHGAPGAATANAPPQGQERAALMDANLAIAAKKRQEQADALRGNVEVPAALSDVRPPLPRVERLSG